MIDPKNGNKRTLHQDLQIQVKMKAVHVTRHLKGNA